MLPQFEAAIGGAVIGPRPGPLRMEVQLHLLPRIEHRLDRRADRGEPIDQRRQRIDEETPLQPVPREQRQMMREPDAAGLERPPAHLVGGQAGGVMPPRDLRVDGEEDVRHGAGV